MNIFSSSKPPSEEEQAAALVTLRSAIETSSSGSEPSVYEQLRQGGEPGLYEDGRIDDLTYGRWLRAENYNAKKAATRLRDHAAWRVKYVPKGTISEVLHTLQNLLSLFGLLFVMFASGISRYPK